MCKLYVCVWVDEYAYFHSVLTPKSSTLTPSHLVSRRLCLKKIKKGGGVHEGVATFREPSEGILLALPVPTMMDGPPLGASEKVGGETGLRQSYGVLQLTTTVRESLGNGAVFGPPLDPFSGDSDNESGSGSGSVSGSASSLSSPSLPSSLAVYPPAVVLALRRAAQAYGGFQPVPYALKVAVDNHRQLARRFSGIGSMKGSERFAWTTFNATRDGPEIAVDASTSRMALRSKSRQVGGDGDDEQSWITGYGELG